MNNTSNSNSNNNKITASTFINYQSTPWHYSDYWQKSHSVDRPQTLWI